MAPILDDHAWVERHFSAAEKVAAQAIAKDPEAVDDVGACTKAYTTDPAGRGMTTLAPSPGDRTA